MSLNHWSDEQLVEHLYGVGPADDHVLTCADCQARFHAVRLSRDTVEAGYCVPDAVDHQMLAAQRRAIYGRIDAKRSSLAWLHAPRRAWASAALAIALIGGGWAIHERPHAPQKASVSDADLAEQVSQIAADEPASAAPLQALFEDE